MFDLEKELHDWCVSVLGKRGDEDLRSELKDHLYCEIEVHQRAGLSQEQAFRLAVSKMGEPGGLLEEFSKNKGLIRHLCEFDENLNAAFAARFPMSGKRRSMFILGNALFFAACILILSWFLKENSTTYVVVQGFLIVGWAFINGLLAMNKKTCKPRNLFGTLIP